MTAAVTLPLFPSACQRPGWPCPPCTLMFATKILSIFCVSFHWRAACGSEDLSVPPQTGCPKQSPVDELINPQELSGANIQLWGTCQSQHSDAGKNTNPNPQVAISYPINISVGSGQLCVVGFGLDAVSKIAVMYLRFLICFHISVFCFV